MSGFSSDSQFHFKDLWQIIVKRKWLIILPLIIITGAAYGVSHLLTELYESKVSILVRRSQVLGPEFRGISEASGYDAVRTQTDLEFWHQSVKNEVLSPATLLKVISDLDLDEDSDLTEWVNDVRSKFPDYNREDLIKVRLIELLQTKHITVGFVRQNVVQIRCQHESPETAREMAISLADAFREEQIRQDLLRIRAKQEFTTEQLSIYKKEWEDAEDALASFKKNYTRSNVNQRVSNEILDGVTAEIDRAKLTTEDMMDQRTFLAANLVSAGIDTAALHLSDEAEGYRSSLTDLLRQKASLLEKYKRTDPKVLEMIGRIKRAVDSLEVYGMESVREAELGLSGRALNEAAEFVFLTVRADLGIEEQLILDKTLDDLSVRFTEWPDYEAEVARLEQKAAAKKEIYLKFNSQLLGSRISEDAFRKEAESRYKILEEATIPLAPVYPDRIRILSLGILLGLVVGGGAILLTEVLDSSIRKVEEAEKYLGLKVLGTVPYIEPKKGRKKRTPRETGRRRKPAEIKR